MSAIPQCNFRIVRRKVMYTNEDGVSVWTGGVREVLQQAYYPLRRSNENSTILQPDFSDVLEWRDVPIEDEHA
jgi:hypothetical protein